MIKKFKVKSKKFESQRGMTLFIAVTIMAILLLISYAVANIAVKGTQFATSGRDSQIAFYAADAGLECALYWDSKHDSFATSTSGSPIDCGDSSISTDMAILGTTTLALVGGGGDDGGGGGGGANQNISSVNTATGSNNASGASISSNSFTANSGNLIVVAIRFYKTSSSAAVSSVTDTAGNSYAFATGLTSGYGDRLELWYAKNISANSSNVVTVAFNSSVTYRVVNVAQYSGIDQVFPLDATAISTTQTGSTITSNSFSTTFPDEVIVSASQVATLTGNWSAGSGYQSRVQDSPSKIVMIQDRIVSSNQSNITASATNSSGPSKTMIVATFKAAPGSPSPSGGSTSVFGFTMNTGTNPIPSCAIVTVRKYYEGSPLVLKTYIKSRGYNTCDTSNSRRVERGIEVTY